MSTVNYPSQFTSLPWFIWNEILDYAIDSDYRDLCYVCKSWFFKYAGKFSIINVGEETPKDNLIYNTEKIAETVIFDRLYQIDWDYIYKFKYIKNIVIQIDYYYYSSDEIIDFFRKIKKIDGVKSLKFSRSNQYSDFPLNPENLDSLQFFNCQLSEIDLSLIFFELNDYKKFFGNTVFSNLTLLSILFNFHNTSSILLSKNFPSLKNLKLSFFMCQDDLNDVIYNMWEQFNNRGVDRENSEAEQIFFAYHEESEITNYLNKFISCDYDPKPETQNCLMFLITTSKFSRIFYLNFDFPKLNELIINNLHGDFYFIQDTEFYFTVYLKLHKIPNIKRLITLKDTVLISDNEYTAQVYELELEYSDYLDPDFIISKFPRLKNLLLSFKFFQLNKLTKFNKLETFIKYLSINVKYNCLVPELPVGCFSATHIRLELSGEIRKGFFSWLSNNFKLFHLEIESYGIGFEFCLDEIQFNDLEFVIIRAEDDAVKEYFKTYFAISKHPKLSSVKVVSLN